jgi:predicted RNase H-like HicB family nuclease
MSSNRDIQIEFDEETQNYYVSWEPPIAIGLGKTKEEALEDLREAAHLGVDTLIDLKLRDVRWNFNGGAKMKITKLEKRFVNSKK